MPARLLPTRLMALWLSFPTEYYENLFRLRGLEFPRDSVKRPKYFGHLTNDIIYKRLAPGVLEELKNVTPKLPSGRRKHHYFRHDFLTRLDRVRPRYGETLPLPLDMPRTGL
jgi:hypothetical protein